MLRNHIIWQIGIKICPQLLFIQLKITDIVGNEQCFAADHHRRNRRIRNRRITQKLTGDLLQFNTIAMQFNLIIFSADDYQFAVVIPIPKVFTPV
ncbi:hypothetical protein SDC9_212757 [bioreactor metagenome]|uniref:Uncharacterized protein n=1 Tax=bioreactor metagenome TaxID=1076179 RepID=A0A645JMU0_9ZZZZ